MSQEEPLLAVYVRERPGALCQEWGLFEYVTDIKHYQDIHLCVECPSLLEPGTWYGKGKLFNYGIRLDYLVVNDREYVEQMNNERIGFEVAAWEEAADK